MNEFTPPPPPPPPVTLPPSWEAERVKVRQIFYTTEQKILTKIEFNSFKSVERFNNGELEEARAEAFSIFYSNVRQRVEELKQHIAQGQPTNVIDNQIEYILGLVS